MIVRFTIPSDYDEPDTIHPLSPDLTSDDWFEVQADTVQQAITYLHQTYEDGYDFYQSTFIVGDRHDEREWMESMHTHRGECKAFIDLWKTESTSNEKELS